MGPPGENWHGGNIVYDQNALYTCVKFAKIINSTMEMKLKHLKDKLQYICLL